MSFATGFTPLKLCRACLATGEDVKFFKMGQNSRFFTDFLGINVLYDGAERLLCCDCSYRISRIISYGSQVLAANNVLMGVFRALNSNGMFSAEVLKSASDSLQFPKRTIYTDMTVIELNYEESIKYDEEFKNELFGMENFNMDLNMDNIKVKLEDSDIGRDYLDDEDRLVDSDEDVLKVIQLRIKSSKKRKKSIKKAEKCIVKRKPNEGKVNSIKLSKGEALEEMLAQAKSAKYMLADFKCELCFKGFYMENRFAEHMDKHKESNGNYKCDLCHQYFGTPLLLKKHDLAHTRRYKCGECDYMKTCWGVVSDHYMDVHERKNMSDIQCNECGKTFAKQNTFRKHACRQDKIKCKFCDKMMLKSSVNEHILRMHTKNKPYECKICHKTFAKPPSLRMHISQRHPDSMEYCADCNLFFSNKAGLRNHLRLTLKHIKEQDLKQCPHCPVRLPYWKCATHIAKEHRKMSHICPDCGVSYICRSSLGRHRRVAHLNIKRERKYVCETCGKGFTVKKTLTSHMNIHTGERPFKCEVCAATFAHPAALYTHNRLVHLKIKRKYDCKKAKAKMDTVSIDDIAAL